MRHQAPSLRVVGPDKVDQRAPEDMLGFLFAREKALLAEIAEVRRELDTHRIRYSDAHGLRVRVGLDGLRRLFG